MSAQTTARRKDGAQIRKIMILIHLWIGLILCVPFVLLGLTGSVLVYEQEIDAMLSPVPQAHAQGAVRAPQAIIDAALAARPGMTAAMLAMPEHAGDPAIVRLQQKRTGGGERRGRAAYTQAAIDPVSLAVLELRQGVRSPFLGLMHNIHGGMMLGGREGRTLVGWLGVGMVALGLSGIVLWWPRNGTWRGAYGVSRRARGWLFHRQLHGTAGITAWIVFVVVSFSGVAIAFPQTIGDGLGAVFGRSALTPQGPGQRQLRVVPVPGGHILDADAALALAQKAAPHARLAAMVFPAAPNQVLRVTLTAEDTAIGAPVISVALDPMRGTVLDLRDPRTASVTDTILLWQRPLHTARGSGPFWRLLVFAVGFLPLLFSITGIAMWWTKRRIRRGREARSQAAPEGVAAE